MEIAHLDVFYTPTGVQPKDWKEELKDIAGDKKEPMEKALEIMIDVGILTSDLKRNFKNSIQIPYFRSAYLIDPKKYDELNRLWRELGVSYVHENIRVKGMEHRAMKIEEESNLVYMFDQHSIYVCRKNEELKNEEPIWAPLDSLL